MRIVIHTQYYPPEIGAPQTRLSELAKAMKAAGHEVIVLTAMPSYPLGRIYPGYGGFSSQEERDGIQVIRAWAYPTQSPNLIKRLSNYFSFVFSSFIVGLLKLPRVDYILTESPPIFLGISGWMLSRFKGARWILNISDLWTETAARIGVLSDGWKRRSAEALERLCYRHAWLVSGQSHEIVAAVQREAPRTPTYHFSNGVNTQTFHPGRRSEQTRRDMGFGDSCIALYSGLHGLAQGLTQVLDAAERLLDQPSIRFVFLGDGPDKRMLKELASSRRLTNVVFLDPVPRERMPDIVSAADIGVVPLKVVLPGAVPSKLYEYMGSGLPVVLAATDEPAKIVENAGCGLVVNPESPEHLAAAIRELAADPSLRSRMATAGRSAAERSYDRVAISQRFAEYLAAQIGAPAEAAAARSYVAD